MYIHVCIFRPFCIHTTVLSKQGSSSSITGTVDSAWPTICMYYFTGLLVQLEKLHSSLLQCRSTLVGYAEGQRAKCHWFHFIPLDDVLQFVCCGESCVSLWSVSTTTLLVHYLLRFFFGGGGGGGGGGDGHDQDTPQF